MRQIVHHLPTIPKVGRRQSRSTLPRLGILLVVTNKTGRNRPVIRRVGWLRGVGCEWASTRAGNDRGLQYRQESMRYFKASSTEIRDQKRRFAIVFITAMAGIASQQPPNCSAGHPAHGPIYRTLDALAGGIEKAISVAGRTATMGGACDSTSCDDGCDAMTLNDLDAGSDYAMPIHGDARMSEPTVAPPIEQPTPPAGSHRPNSTPRLKPQPLLDSEPMPMREPMEIQEPRPVREPMPMRESRPMPIPQPLQEPMSTPTEPADDGWFDSLSPGSKTPTSKRLIPEPRALRSPSETIDTLEDPFKDDPQGRRSLKSANQPASYWEPW